MTDASHLLVVVDGSRISRTVIARGLRAEIGGADVTACASAGEGLKACASGRFDCITAVLPLPDMGGEEFTRQCRKLPRQRYTPLVVMSGDGDAALLRDFCSRGDGLF